MSMTRRTVLGGAVGASAMIVSPHATAQPARPFGPARSGKPNIIYIMADDMGYGDLGCYGHAYQTPNIDRLAHEGMKFTQAYANSAVCTATRVGLVTGRYQNRLPVGQQEPLGASARTIGLEPDVPTMPRYMQQLGYRTALVGKWHMGDAPRFGPLKSGYDRFFGIYSGGKDYFVQPQTMAGGLVDGDKLVAQHRYLTDELADRALREIKEARQDGVPLFMSLHFTAPHWPWEGPEDGPVAQAHKGAIFMAEDGSVRVFQRMMTSLDIAVGKVLQLLADLDQVENTIVVFTSDNGGERYSNVWPLTGMKTELLEGGIRVPVLVRWPGQVKAGSVSDQVCISMDWMPTFIAAGGAPATFSAPTDGMSILPQLTGAATVGRKLFWQFKANEQAAHRDGDWKFLRIAGHEYLFNLSFDEHERSNFSRKEPARFDAMKQAHAAWAATMLPYPKDSSSYNLVGQVPDRYSSLTPPPAPANAPPRE
jgi:arylsulfatase A-like enzyme